MWFTKWFLEGLQKATFDTHWYAQEFKQHSVDGFVAVYKVHYKWDGQLIWLKLIKDNTE